MDSEITIQLEIPADENGYVLFQCPKCGEYFKITPSDYENEEIEDIWCPSCGMISENYLTEDVIELARTKLENACMNMLHEEFKNLERQTKGKAVSIKAGNKPSPKHEAQINSAIDNLIEMHVPCCGNTIKLPLARANAVYYCPFCGEMHEADE